MATFLTSDVIRHELFSGYVQQALVQNSSFLNSGIVTTDPTVDAAAKSSQSAEAQIKYITELDGTSKIASGTSATAITPNKLSTGIYRCVKHFRTEAWEQAQLTKFFVGSDPLANVAAQIAKYWDREIQKALISSVIGIFADNAANDSGDMIVNVATDSASAITDAERISPSLIIDAEGTMGDSDSLAGICMHSVVYTKLKKLNEITFVRASESSPQIPFYRGKLVIVNDNMPAVAGAHRITYHTYLFGMGAVVYADGAHPEPLAEKIDDAAYNGAGSKMLISRNNFIIHPQGWEFKSVSIGEISPSNAELEEAQQWDRKAPRKLCKIACIKTNG